MQTSNRKSQFLQVPPSEEKPNKNGLNKSLSSKTSYTHYFVAAQIEEIGAVEAAGFGEVIHRDQMLLSQITWIRKTEIREYLRRIVTNIIKNVIAEDDVAALEDKFNKAVKIFDDLYVAKKKAATDVILKDDNAICVGEGAVATAYEHFIKAHLGALRSKANGHQEGTINDTNAIMAYHSSTLNLIKALDTIESFEQQVLRFAYTPPGELQGILSEGFRSTLDDIRDYHFTSTDSIYAPSETEEA